MASLREQMAQITSNAGVKSIASGTADRRTYGGANDQKQERDSQKAWVDRYTKTMSTFTNRFKNANGENTWTQDSSYGTRNDIKSLIEDWDSAFADVPSAEYGKYHRVVGSLQKMLDGFDQTDAYYAKFRDQNDYDYTRSNMGGNVEGWSPELFGITEDQAANLRKYLFQRNSKRLEQMKPQLDAAQQAAKRAELAYKSAARAGSFGNGTQIADLYDEWSKKQNEYQQLKSEYDSAYQQNHSYEYSGIKGKDDNPLLMQKVKASNVDTGYKGDDVESYRFTQISMIPDEDINASVGDKLGLFLSASESDLYDYEDSIPTVWGTIRNEGVSNNWNMLQQDEIQTYYWILQNSGQQQAYSYLDGLTRTLNYRAQQNMIKEIDGLSPAAQAVLALASSPIKVGGDILSAVTTVGQMTEGDINPYSAGYSVTNTVNRLRSNTQNNIETLIAGENGGAVRGAISKLAGNSFQAVMSGIDSVAGAAMFGAGYMPVMSAGAFSNRALELAHQGASRKDILIGSIAAGAIEWATESVGIDNLVKGFGKEKLSHELMRQMASEGIEEGVSDIANLAVDALSRAGNSDLQQNIRQLMQDEGLSYDEARKKAYLQQAKDTMWSIYGGIISGGAMVGGGIALNSAIDAGRNAVNNYGTGRDILQSGKVGELTEKAGTLGEAKQRDKLTKAAKKVAGLTVNENGEAGFRDSMRVGKVASRINNQAAKEFRDAEINAFRAKAKAFIEQDSNVHNKKFALDTIVRMKYGQTLMAGQKAYYRTLGGDKYLQKIMDSVGKEIESDAKGRREKSLRTMVAVSGLSTRNVREAFSETAFDTSEDHQPRMKQDGSPVNITGIDGVENGRLMLSTDDGRTVAASDVSHGSRAEAMLYSFLEASGVSSETAKAVEKAAQSAKGKPEDFARGIRNAYLAGHNGTPFNQINSGSYAAKLDETTRRQMWEAGRATRDRMFSGQAETVDRGKHGKAKGGLHYGVDLRGRKLSASQESAVKLCKVLAGMGMDVTIYESTAQERAQGMANGEFVIRDGSILVDLAAGDAGQGLMGYAVSHEFTHFVREFNPEEFKTFTDVLIVELAKDGIRYDDLMQEQIAKLSTREENKSKSEEEINRLAEDETLAEMLETMLTDTDAAQRIADKVGRENESILSKIVSFLKNLVKDLKEAYKGLSPESRIAAAVKESITTNERIVELFSDVAAQAVENYNLQEEWQKNNTSGEVMNSTRYSYNELTAKKDMQISYVEDISGKTREQIVTLAKENALKCGGKMVNGSPAVTVADINKDVILSTRGLRHGLDRRFSELAPITIKAGEIIQNSIRINELTPSKENASGSYVLIGMAQNNNSERFVVRTIVNEFSNEVESVDVLYAINAKKEPAALNAPRLTGSPLSVTGSKVTIAELLDSVNRNFPDVLPEDVLKHYGYSERPDGKLGESALYSSRKVDENVKAAIDSYKAQRDATDKAMKALYEQERKNLAEAHKRRMSELKAEYSADSKIMEQEFMRILRAFEAEQRQSGRKGNSLAALQEKLSAELKSHKEDNAAWSKEFNRLLGEYESAGRSIEKLEKDVAHRKESARAKVESAHKTEMRHKIQRTVDTLNRYLLSPTKTVHVPESMQPSVALAMEAIEGAISAGKAGENVARLQAYHRELNALMKDPKGNAEKIAELNRKSQNLLVRDGKMKSAMRQLMDSYKELSESGNPVYDDVIAGIIEDCYDSIGDTEYGKLSLAQLSKVNDAYRAVLKRIQTSNKAFRDSKGEAISEKVDRLSRELASKKKHGMLTSKTAQGLEQFLWNNEKPEYAFARMDSQVLTDLFHNLRNGEDTWYRDVQGAKSYCTDRMAQYGYDTWDFEKLYDFESAGGRKFQLNLDEVMSLYAYSLREQAFEHLQKGGIVLDENTERTVKDRLGVKHTAIYNDANAYNLSPDTILHLGDCLTAEQRQFATDMQKYLSEVMGEKGNEVSLAMYDIRLFKEQYYWPLKSSSRFSERVKESQQNPGNKIKNSGFTKSTVKHANNPVELSGFMQTWAEHINQMSMYHAFTLPMEDFYRVYNWHSGFGDELQQSASVQSMMEEVYGKGAVRYIDEFLKDLNGGLRSDPRETLFKASLSRFKKAAVFASLSVTIQQPSAIGRAFSVISPAYFVGSKVENADKSWEQCKKYAPVAGIKEMGRFDMDMGRSTEEYIMGGKNGIMAKADEVLGLAPEMADQITWCAIWEAAKRQTASRNPGLQGEALLKKAGELFTECITKTQVYDSVFSRSSNMRSKSGLMQMATAFMAEPTTTANMVEHAFRQWQKGYRVSAAKTVGSVMASIALNSLLVSFIYAARDGDEEKTFWEKYLGKVAGEMAESLNPITYVPYAKDIWSLFQGYDVERSDMSLWADAAKAAQKMIKAASKYKSNATDEEMQEWLASMKAAGWSALDAVSSLLGIPEKNLRRDYMAAVNMFKPGNWADSSDLTIWNAVKEEVISGIPLWNQASGDSKGKKLYDAYTSGDKAYIQRMERQYATKEKLDAALRTSLRENDPRIKEAAEALVGGDNGKYMDIMGRIADEGYFSKDIVKGAISTAATKITSTNRQNLIDSDKRITQAAELIIAAKKDEANDIIASIVAEKKFSRSTIEGTVNSLVSDLKTGSYYSVDDYVYAMSHGIGSADSIAKDIIHVMTLNGKTKEEAEKTFRNSVKANVREAIEDDEITDEKALSVLVKSGIFKDEETIENGQKVMVTAQDSARLWIYRYRAKAESGADTVWTNLQTEWYIETAEPAGIDKTTYTKYLNYMAMVKGIDANGDGVIDRLSKQREAAEYIDLLPLSDDLKQLLFKRYVKKGKYNHLTPWYKRGYRS